MKIIYSHLQKLLPDLNQSPRKVADDLTMIGHLSDGLEKRGSQSVISLEIRQNRGDCLSYYGIAKELSVLYNIPFKIPQFNLSKTSQNYSLPIKVAAKKQVRRLIAIRLSHLSNHPSPKWLKQFLKLHEINSINTIVDLTNYIMLWYGIPNHAFDAQKSGESLVWAVNNNQFKNFTTLEDDKVNLEPETLIIHNGQTVVSLAGIIGGRNSGINLNTTEAIVEMAIYNKTRVHKDSRKLKIITEASTRLDKELDTQLIPQAFKHLIQLILTYCAGEISSNLVDIYLQKPPARAIKFAPHKVSQYAGINIPKEFTLKTLKKLGCQIKKGFIVPPTSRADLNLKEDLIEEAIRFYGYHKIPTNQPISDKKMPDITPKTLYLIEAVKNILVNLNYDEIRSWPLIEKKNICKNRELPKNAHPFYTQNNINSDYPILRQSIVSSLITQKKQYEKFKVTTMQFFEIGKIFYQIGPKYYENYSLAIYNQSVDQLQKDSQELLHQLNFNDNNIPIIKIDRDAFVEINLDKLVKKIAVIPKINAVKTVGDRGATVELNRQIITQDANVFLPKKEDPQKLITQYSQKISNQYLWQIEIIDIYQDSKTKQYKYTFRISYFNIDDKTAKKIHRKVFNLSH